jgi:hypothetical protein
MSIPHTLLSLLYHSHISPYREEIHQSHTVAGQRFAIDDATFALLQVPSLPKAADVMSAADATASAAFDLRKGVKGAQDQMNTATKELFGLLAQLLAAEITSGDYKDQPNQDLPTEDIRSQPLLVQLYFLVYSNEYRTRFQAKRGFEAWDHVQHVLQELSQDSFEELLPYAHTVCQQVANEYSESLWPKVW